jgi:hypothetical protein
MNYNQITAGSAGNGDYLVTLPAGYSFDTTVHPIQTSNTDGDDVISYVITASVMTKASGVGFNNLAMVMPYSSTTFRVWRNEIPRIRWGSGWLPLSTAYVEMMITFVFKKS